MRQIYTQTEKGNPHVVRMNLRLGYRVVREGTMHDEVVIVSMVKNLNADTNGETASSDFA